MTPAIVLALALDDYELPTVRKVLADCGCTCWWTPSIAALRLAIDVILSCEVHAERYPLTALAEGERRYPRELLAEAVGTAGAEHLMVLARACMATGLPV